MLVAFELHGEIYRGATHSTTENLGQLQEELTS
jgi:hypothetical protein